MGKSISVHELVKKDYPVLGLSEEWVPYIGQPAKKLRMIVWGDSGQGKTTLVLKLSKALAKIGKVYYNSAEEGEGHSLKANMIRNKVAEETDPGMLMLGDRDSFEEMYAKLAKPRNRIKFLVIDSLQYLKMDQEQYKRLNADFPKVGIIMISWSDGGGNPKGTHADAIRFMCDIKTYVKKGVAYTDSRFGSTIPYQVIPWHEKERPAKGKKQQDAQQQELQMS